MSGQSGSENPEEILAGYEKRIAAGEALTSEEYRDRSRIYDELKGRTGGRRSGTIARQSQVVFVGGDESEERSSSRGRQSVRHDHRVVERRGRA